MSSFLKPTLRERLEKATTALTGLWNASGSPVAAEILCAAGADILVIDGEHGSLELHDITAVLRASEPYPTTPLVRVHRLDPTRIQQTLDLGAQNILVPMVYTASQAQQAAEAMRYPGRKAPGRRGIGAALARASRWGLESDYVARAQDLVSLTVQIETADAVRHARQIASVDGVDAVFIGPADLAGSLGHPGNPGHSEVHDAVGRAIEAVRDAGKPVGINAFNPADADRYRAAGAAFVVVSADVTLMAKGATAALDRARSPLSAPATAHRS